MRTAASMRAASVTSGRCLVAATVPRSSRIKRPQGCESHEGGEQEARQGGRSSALVLPMTAGHQGCLSNAPRLPSYPLPRVSFSGGVTMEACWVATGVGLGNHGHGQARRPQGHLMTNLAL